MQNTGHPDATNRKQTGAQGDPGSRTRVLVLTKGRSTWQVAVDTLKETRYTVVTAGRPWEAMQEADETHHDLVILDMRSLDNLDRKFVRDISRGHEIPLIFLAGGGSHDVAAAFRMRGDDCITDPMQASETLARVEESLRRRSAQRNRENPDILRLARMTINQPAQQASISGNNIELTAIEFDLLWELASNAGRVMTHQILLDRVWSWDHPVESGTLRMAMKGLRRKLGDDAKSPTYIFTVIKVGYRMKTASG